MLYICAVHCMHHHEASSLFHKKHMDAKMGAAQSQINNFEPLSDVIHEDECDTLLLYLPGFMKENLRVQLASSGYLKISGSRPLGEYKSFEKDFPISHNCDKAKITAKFEGGILYVKQPKISPKPQSTTKLPNEVEASSSLQTPNKDQEKETMARKIVEKSKTETASKSKKEEDESSVEQKVNEKMSGSRDDQTSNDATTGVITSCDRSNKARVGDHVAGNNNKVINNNAAERLKRAMNVFMALVFGFVIGFYLRNLVWGTT